MHDALAVHGMLLLMTLLYTLVHNFSCYPSQGHVQEYCSASTTTTQPGSNKIRGMNKTRSSCYSQK